MKKLLTAVLITAFFLLTISSAVSADEDKGLVGFAPSIERASELPRVGETPLIVEAVEVNGEDGTVVVVSNEDAAEINRELESTKVFRQANVVAVIDE